MKDIYDCPVHTQLGLSLILTRLALDAAWIAAVISRYRVVAWSEAQAHDRAGARAVITNGSTGLSADELATLPVLELIVSFGAGYENIDLAAARRRNICVCHAPDVTAQAVADHALALSLALARGIPALDRAVKAGAWESLRTPRPVLRDKALGIVGLGNIGQRLARMAEAIGMRVAYLHHRSSHVNYAAYPDAVSLAQAVDVLVLTCPGGSPTYHLVNATVLRALGANGFLVNVARGSVVDTDALIHALAHGVIAGAALDVLETEPQIPDALRTMGHVILTPHMAGRTPETRIAQHQCLEDNLDGWFTQKRVTYPVKLPD